MMGTRLKLLRNERRIYQREMADLLKVTQAHYQKIESGKINIPTLTLYTLARYFGVSTDYLLGLSDERPAPPEWPFWAPQMPESHQNEKPLAEKNCLTEES
ncbi:MAG: helix-turn-helix transcriptional regulator [Oscillibacter sp.]|nr:helix-turn-helix transcriptional regulator [Oscillibacter sp.]